MQIRRLGVLLLLLWAMPQVFAQTGLELGAKYIPQTVWHFNNADFSEGDKLNFTPTYTRAYGLHFGVNFSDFFGVQSGYILSEQGQKYVHKHVGSAESSEIRLSYRKIPLLLKFNTDPISGISFIANAGLQLGVLTEATYLENNESVDLGIDYTDWYNNTDVSVLLGAGARFNVSEVLNFDLMLRTDYSIRDIENKSFDGGLNQQPLVWQINELENRGNTHNFTAGVQLGVNFLFAR